MLPIPGQDNLLLTHFRLDFHSDIALLERSRIDRIGRAHTDTQVESRVVADNNGLTSAFDKAIEHRFRPSHRISRQDIWLQRIPRLSSYTSCGDSHGQSAEEIGDRGLSSSQLTLRCLAEDPSLAPPACSFHCLLKTWSY